MLLPHGEAVTAWRVGVVGYHRATQVEKHEWILQLFLQTCAASVKLTTGEVFFLKMTTAEVFLLCLQTVYSCCPTSGSAIRWQHLGKILRTVHFLSCSRHSVCS